MPTEGADDSDSHSVSPWWESGPLMAQDNNCYIQVSKKPKICGKPVLNMDAGWNNLHKPIIVNLIDLLKCI